MSCLMDGLGSLLAGTLAPVSRVAGAYAAESWRGDVATIAQHDPRRGLVSGCAQARRAQPSPMRARRMRSTSTTTRSSPVGILARNWFRRSWPSARNAGQADAPLLEALVVGYEIAIRAGRCWHAHHADYQADGSWGSVACAAAAAHLMGLDPERIGHALGIAEYHAPNAPMMRDIAEPAMVKHGIGWGAMTGVTAAELAACGYTGIPSLLGFPEFAGWVGDLGQTYWMTDWVFHKSWASCAWGHAACLAAQQVVAANGLTVEGIAAYPGAHLPGGRRALPGLSGHH